MLHTKTRPAPLTPTTAHRSQREVAELLGISRTRVSQIEERALNKIRKRIQSEAAAAGVTVGEWLFGD